MRRADNHLHVPNVLKSGRLNLLEPSGPIQACNGIALPVNNNGNKNSKTRDVGST